MRREKLIKAQEKYCKDHKVPMFAPELGYCPHCHSDIVNEKWAKEHITGCPYCHHSFCD